MAKEATNHQGKLAVVTGASSGIGYELAAQFAQHGFDLIVCAENDGISQAAEDLRQLGTKVQPVQADLSTAAGVMQFVQAVRADGRPVACAAINAGIGVDGPFAENALEDEITLINTNVMGTVCIAKHIIQDMTERAEGGKILFTSSVASLAAGPYMACYNASKAFIQSFSEALHVELKDKGISVTALMPDATDTEFFERAGMLDTKVGAGDKDDPALVAKRGYNALMEGKASVFGGSLKHRLLNAVEDLIPEQVKAKQYAKAAKPGSAAEDSAKKKKVS